MRKLVSGEMLLAFLDLLVDDGIVAVQTLDEANGGREIARGEQQSGDQHGGCDRQPRHRGSGQLVSPSQNMVDLRVVRRAMIEHCIEIPRQGAHVVGKFIGIENLRQPA